MASPKYIEQDNKYTFENNQNLTANNTNQRRCNNVVFTRFWAFRVAKLTLRTPRINSKIYRSRSFSYHSRRFSYRSRNYQQLQYSNLLFINLRKSNYNNQVTILWYVISVNLISISGCLSIQLPNASVSESGASISQPRMSLLLLQILQSGEQNTIYRHSAKPILYLIMSQRLMLTFISLIQFVILEKI